MKEKTDTQIFIDFDAISIETHDYKLFKQIASIAKGTCRDLVNDGHEVFIFTRLSHEYVKWWMLENRDSPKYPYCSQLLYQCPPHDFDLQLKINTDEKRAGWNEAYRLIEAICSWTYKSRKIKIT